MEPPPLGSAHDECLSPWLHTKLVSRQYNYQILTTSSNGVKKYQATLKIIGIPNPVISLMFLSTFASPEIDMTLFID